MKAYQSLSHTTWDCKYHSDTRPRPKPERLVSSSWRTQGVSQVAPHRRRDRALRRSVETERSSAAAFVLAFGAIDVRIQLFVELAYPFEAQT